MPSPDRHFANAAIFTHSASGITPNSGDAALYIKSDNKAYIKDSTGAELPVASIGGSAGTTDNLVLRADGTGGATIQNSAIQIDDATTSTQNNVAIINADSQTNSSLVLTPKGTGALIAQKPNGAASGGNARGANAVDWQTATRSAATQVASGARSGILAGIQNTASGADSIVCGGEANTTAAPYSFIGSGNNNSVTSSSDWGIVVGGQVNSISASSQHSFIGGGRGNQASAGSTVVAGGGIWTGSAQVGNTASGTLAAILGGFSSVANRYGMQAHANGSFSGTASGDAQRARFVMRNKTTTNSAVELFLDGSSTRLTIPSGKYVTGTINIAGIKSDGTAAASYIRQFSIKNVAGTTSLVGTVNTIGTDEAAGTSISITANDTNDALKVDVTGITSETWRWVAAVDVVEVAYGS